VILNARQQIQELENLIAALEHRSPVIFPTPETPPALLTLVHAPTLSFLAPSSAGTSSTSSLSPSPSSSSFSLSSSSSSRPFVPRTVVQTSHFSSVFEEQPVAASSSSPGTAPSSTRFPALSVDTGVTTCSTEPVLACIPYGGSVSPNHGQEAKEVAVAVNKQPSGNEEVVAIPCHRGR